MSIHASKGLEFPCVFIIGCEDGILPFTLLGQDGCDREEERKLLYVGMTRAKAALFYPTQGREGFTTAILSSPNPRFYIVSKRNLLKGEKRRYEKGV